MLLCVLGLIGAVELGVLALRDDVIDEVPFMYRIKTAEAEHGPARGVLVLGDSQGAGAVRPSRIRAALPELPSIYNFAILGSGPSGGEIILRRYLETHPAPELVLVLYTPPAYSAAEAGWVVDTDPIRFLYGAADTLRAAWRSGNGDFLTSWIGTRLPSLRYRDSLKSGFVSLVLDRSPALQARARRALGYGRDETSDYQFRFRYTARATRNRDFRQGLADESGWYYWKPRAMRGERLPDRARYHVPRFVPSRPERLALRTLLGQARAEGIPVRVLSAPLPQGAVTRMEAVGDLARVEAYWDEVREEFPELQLLGPPVVARPHAEFSDPIHLNPRGIEGYTQRLLPKLRAAWAEIGARRR